jgi:hypothetical protein
MESLVFSNLRVAGEDGSVIKCVGSSGAKMSLPHETVQKIPYLNTLLLGSFARPTFTSDGETVLPNCIKIHYLEPVVGGPCPCLSVSASSLSFPFLDLWGRRTTTAILSLSLLHTHSPWRGRWTTIIDARAHGRTR